MRHTVPSYVIRNLYTTIVLHSLDYCDMVWSGCTETAAKKLEVVQNNGARAIVGAPYQSPATTLRNQLGWPSLNKRRELHTATWVYRCLRPGLTYTTYFSLSMHKQHQHHTRLSNNGVLIPRAHTNMMSRLFHYTGAVLWNSLPDDIKGFNRGSTFRATLMFLFLLYLIPSLYNIAPYVLYYNSCFEICSACWCKSSPWPNGSLNFHFHLPTQPSDSEHYVPGLCLETLGKKSVILPHSGVRTELQTHLAPLRV